MCTLCYIIEADQTTFIKKALQLLRFFLGTQDDVNLSTIAKEKKTKEKIKKKTETKEKEVIHELLRRVLSKEDCFNLLENTDFFPICRSY